MRGAPGVILWGPLRLDLRARRAEVGDCDLELTSAELRILELLVRADTRTVTRDELMTQALGRRLLPTDRSLDTHVTQPAPQAPQAHRSGERAERARLGLRTHAGPGAQRRA